MRSLRLSPIQPGRTTQPGRFSVPLLYLTGLLPVLAVLLIRVLLWPIVEQRSPFLLLAVAVLAAAWFGGRGPGLLATAAGAVIGAFFFLQPKFSLRIAEPPEAVELFFFILVGAGITLLSHRLKSARQSVELAARRNTEILECIQDGFVAIDRDHRFTYVNQAAEGMLARSKADLIGRSVWKAYPEMAGTPIETQCRRAIAGQTAVRFEYCDPGSGRWADIGAYPATDGGLAVYFREITERKRNEQAISQMAAIVDSSDDAIISVDLTGGILTWNAAAERIYGHTAEEVKGRSIVLLVPPDRAGEQIEILENLARGESVEHFESVGVRKNGQPIHVSVTYSPICASAAIVGASGIIRDITGRKELEEQLRQTANLESLGVLAGGIAHDFNNLLVGVLGNASLASELAPPSSPVQPLLEHVIEAGQRAATLTRQLLAYSGKERFFVEPRDLSELVREMSDRLRASLPETVQLRLELAAGLPPVSVDTAQMQQLVLSLAINGAEAIGDRPGAVTVTTSSESIDQAGDIGGLGDVGECVVLAVVDNGAGMDEATIDKIFDPFYTTKFTGRGLGLSAVLGIVRGHKGWIQVSSSPGRGSTLRVLLPVAQDRSAASEGGEMKPDFKQATGCGAVLIVDDEEIVRRTAAMALRSRGYTVLEASDAHEAIELVRKSSRPIELVVLDLSMPVMSGEECLARLKEIQPNLPVILSSGFTEAEANRKFRASGATSFLQKPYTAARLAEKIRATLSPVEDKADRVPA